MTTFEQMSPEDRTRADVYGLTVTSRLFDWSGWLSPVGLGAFVVALGLFLVLLHYAGLIGV